MRMFWCCALIGTDALIAEDGSTLIDNLGIGNTNNYDYETPWHN